MEESLWVYILKEAQVQHDGERLGAVGSTIVAAVFSGLMRGDPYSYIYRSPHWTPADEPVDGAPMFVKASAELPAQIRRHRGRWSTSSARPGRPRTGAQVHAVSLAHPGVIATDARASVGTSARDVAAPASAASWRGKTTFSTMMMSDAATGIATSAPRMPPRVPPATAAITTSAPGTETARFMMLGLITYASTCM